MTPQQRANKAATELWQATRELQGDQVGEMIIVLRSTVDTTQSFMTWDWFWRSKTSKPDTEAGTGNDAAAKD
jgi:hypothetical protein